MIKKEGKGILSALSFSLSILGVGIMNIFSLPIWIPILIAFVLGVLYFYVDYTKTRDLIHSFEENSAEFFDYFKKWYEKEGELSIYCNDLNWLENPEGGNVLNTIKAKGNKAHIFVRNYSDSTREYMKSSGVNIYQVAGGTLKDHRFSILKSNGVTKIIIRNKDDENNNNKILFIETDSHKDPYLINITIDLLESGSPGFKFA